MLVIQFYNAPGVYAQSSAGSQRILIAYFTNPEPDGVDAVARASRVVRNGEVVGNTQFLAQCIQRAMGGDLFAIETVQAYPARPELMTMGADEKRLNARPPLKRRVPNPGNYDVIFLGFPIWNADLPMAVYTFLEENNFSGKTIVPFSAHGGSGFANTIRTVARLQPNATVITDGFTVSRDRVGNAETDVRNWTRRLNLGQ
ncbi:flavodoxin [Breznakiella homolactica]|uniref:Flavodoxin n=2 Tax=Breznakiella homolactica TaxID=2798577 RepID=A0A7T7XRY3_9SPIR|nr:flavodoxin [Breznakiella homolactica]